MPSLNSVIPVGLVVIPLKQKLRLHAARVVQGVLALWNHFKISKLGKYSDRRSEALDKYCESTSLWRVFSVCALTPWPSLLLAILLECIPLQIPGEGWRNNVGVWIRLGGIGAFAALGALFQLRSATPKLSRWSIVCIVVGTGCGVSLAMVALSASWVFPLPFLIVIASFPFQIFFASLFIGSFPRPTACSIPQLGESLSRKLYLIIAQTALSIVYVIFGLIFAKCTPKQQFGMFLVLPLMKRVLKVMVARLASDSKEVIPAVVVFTVDVFNGLYMPICVQTSRVWWTPLIVIVLNIGHAVFSLWGINQESRVFRSRNKQLESLMSISRGLLRSTTQIVPSGETPRTAWSVRKSSASSTPETSLKRHSREILFRLEYLALVTYTESVMPTLYVIYLFVLFHLPSAIYYPHTSDLTYDQLLTTSLNIMAYALVDMVTLILFHIVLKRKLGVSLLYQLAFVLENEADLIQGRLFVWLPPILEFTLAHFGVDFSFRFEWIRSSSAG